MKEILDTLNAEVETAIIENEVPIAALIVKDNKIICSSHNKKISNNDPTCHAEINCIRICAKKMKSWNLNDCIIYVTIKPCDMCLNVINEARIKEVHYFLDNDKIMKKNIKIIQENENIFSKKYKKKLISFFKKMR